MKSLTVINWLIRLQTSQRRFDLFHSAQVTFLITQFRHHLLLNETDFLLSRQRSCRLPYVKRFLVCEAPNFVLSLFFLCIRLDGTFSGEMKESNRLVVCEAAISVGKTAAHAVNFLKRSIKFRQAVEVQSL